LGDVHLEGEEIFYLLTNVGDTKAEIIEGWILVESPDVLRPLRSAGHYDLNGLTFAGGETKDLTYRIPVGFSFDLMYPGVRERIKIEGEKWSSGANSYFTGTIVYADDLGNRRRTVFRRRWNSKSFVRLSPEEERDHEYSD
jgi:hypothetical protein